MKLTIMERLLLLNVLPERGNAVTLRIVRQLQERLSFSEQDIEKYGIVWLEDQSGVRWDQDKGEEETEIKIGSTAHALILKSLQALDDSEELELQHLTLLDKFGIGQD